MPTLSVLMPVYNAQLYLKEAIDSIINQTYCDWELIIINDGSTDNSEFIINSYTDPRIKYYRNEKNLGLIASLNKGIGFCEGKYIARMDADDISMPDRFLQQISFLEDHAECVMCGTDAKIIDQNGEETGKIINLTSDEYLKINLLFSVPFIHPSVMIRSAQLKELLFDKDYKHAEDYELWCRISDKYKVANMPSFLLKYRWHTNNVSVLNNDSQESVKNKIIRCQLQKLGLSASDHELMLHRITFQQYDAKGDLRKTIFSDYTGLQEWFKKITDANKTIHKYDMNSLYAYLWSRWIVLCISQKKYFRALTPRFIPYQKLVQVWMKIVPLLLFLRRK